jgi:pimeloyl-ACP methyl ester carboxylesterase
MGGNVSEFEVGDDVENDLAFLYKDETLTDLFNRNLRDMTNVLLQPKRLEYDSSWLTTDDNGCADYTFKEFKLHVSDTVLACAKWTKNPNSDIIFIYLHTNARALVDATEILPLCNLLDANLLAFDMRGCGKSEGRLTLSLGKDVKDIVDLLIEKQPEIKIIIWARGISTYGSIDYASSQNIPKNIKFMILDTPFTSIEDIVLDAATSIKSFGVTVPSLFVKFALNLVRKSVRKEIKFDPYNVKPVAVAYAIRIPCYVLSADEDEYINDAMSQRLFETLTCPRWYRQYPGTHFGARDPCVVMAPIDKILIHLAESHDDNCDTSAGSVGHKSKSTDSISTGYEVIEKVEQTNVEWTPDSEANNCELCLRQFTVFIRRHHCRNCGNVVCNDCSLQRIPLPHLHQESPVRVCDKCLANL